MSGQILFRECLFTFTDLSILAAKLLTLLLLRIRP
jgi:hypothetical protein